MPEPEAEYTDKVSVALEDLYTCARVWEAWQYGTMTDADFSLANEDPDVIENVMAVVRPLLTALDLADKAPHESNCGTQQRGCMEERCTHRHWTSGQMPTHTYGSDCPPRSLVCDCWKADYDAAKEAIS